MPHEDLPPPEDASLVKVLVDYVDEGVQRSERLWAKALGDARYEIRNTPWFVYGINWGDTVRCAQPTTDDVPHVVAVERGGGHKTLRVIFNTERVDRERQEQILSTLNEMNGFHERYNDRFLAIDVEPQADYTAVFDFLARCTEDELLVFEEAWQQTRAGFGPSYEDTQPEPGWHSRNA